MSGISSDIQITPSGTHYTVPASAIVEDKISVGDTVIFRQEFSVGNGGEFTVLKFNHGTLEVFLYQPGRPDFWVVMEAIIKLR